MVFFLLLYLVIGVVYAVTVSRHPAANGFGLLDYACAALIWPYLLWAGWQKLERTATRPGGVPRHLNCRCRVIPLAALIVAAALIACSPVFAADPAPVSGGDISAAQVSAPAPAIAAPAPVIQTRAAMPALPTLPADRSPNGWIFWVLASLIPFLGWCVSEVQAISPGLKSNGILHWFLLTTGAIKADPDKQTVTLDLAEFRQLVQNQVAASPGPESLVPSPEV